MRAIVASDQVAGTAGLRLEERRDPGPAINDVLVEVHTSGFVGTELDWPSTWAPSADGRAIDFVVEPDRSQLNEIVQRVRDGRLRTNVGHVADLDHAVAALNHTERVSGKTVISVRS